MEQHRLSRLYSHQQFIGDHFDVRSDLPNEIQQGNSIQKADGVIRNNDGPAVIRNSRSLELAQSYVQVEMPQYRFHEIKAKKVRVVLFEPLKAVFAEQQA